MMTQPTLSPLQHLGDRLLSSIPAACGVYWIVCLIGSKKVYVGSSYDMADRCYRHLWMLVNNCYFSPHLQRAWIKFGSDNFCFEVLEHSLSRDNVLEREQYWIDATACCNQRYGYNVNPIADRPPVVPMTEAGLAKMKAGVSRAHRGIPKSASHRAKIGASQRGVPESPTDRARNIAVLRAYWANPENVAFIKSRLKGRVAWNKGLRGVKSLKENVT